jgi:FKBP-type peptidyl-prolyl cis-trans isomerase (trigger factor)
MAKITITIADAVSEAFGIFEELAGEMGEWGDNIEEKFSTTAKYDTIRTTQETLEGLIEPDIPDSLGKIEIERYEVKQKRRQSRANRCSEAVLILEDCMEALDSIEDEAKNKEEAKLLYDELDTAKGEAEGCEFPGMYG